jgi:hypothetical protein
LSPNREQWVLLWDRAKELESQVPVRKRAAFAQLLECFPGLKHKNFGSLALAGRQGRLANDVGTAVGSYEREINALISEAAKCREESDRLLKERQRADTRRVLNAATDGIPPGPYPKLRECKMYPLRRDCNYGENATSRWNRCEYMNYDNSKSAFDPTRWVCIAPE